MNDIEVKPQSQEYTPPLRVTFSKIEGPGLPKSRKALRRVCEELAQILGKGFVHQPRRPLRFTALNACNEPG